MAALDSCLLRLTELATFRRAAEARAGHLWRDIVFLRFETQHLDPLQRAEIRLQVALQAAGNSIDQALREL